MSYESLFKLKTNPFRLTPALNPHEIVWAGFPELKKVIITRVEFSMKIPNSSLVLNWGEYGSGKTHSALYFSDKKNLSGIANKIQKKSPFPINLLLPKGKDPVHEFFVSIMDNIDLKKLREEFADHHEDIKKIISQSSANEQINNIVLQIFSTDIEVEYLKQYFYGILSKTDIKNTLSKYGILRFLTKSDDYVKLISLLFTCLTYGQKYYSSVIFWIDEFEDIQTLNSSSIDQINNFIRELINNTPNYLLLFLNFTLSPVDSEEDISKYLSAAVFDRIKYRIEFKQPSLEDLKKYLRDLLNDEKFRTEKVDNPYQPFTEETIEFIENKMGLVSLRRYNEAFSILLDIAEMNKNDTIDREFAEKYEREYHWS